MDKQNTGLRVRRHERPFTIVENHTMENANLSWKAKGVLVYLLGRPDGWKGRIYDLVRHSHDGPKAVRSALNELRMEGYAKFDKEISVSAEGWRHLDRFYVISDRPIFYDDPENAALRSKERGTARRWQARCTRSVTPKRRGHDHNGHDPYGHDHRGHDRNGQLNKKKPSKNSPSAHSYEKESTNTNTNTAASGAPPTAPLAASGAAAGDGGTPSGTSPSPATEAQEEAKLFLRAWGPLVRKLKGYKIKILPEAIDRVEEFFETNPEWYSYDILWVAFQAILKSDKTPRPPHGTHDPYCYCRGAANTRWFGYDKDGNHKVTASAEELHYNQELTEEEVNAKIDAFFQADRS